VVQPSQDPSFDDLYANPRFGFVPGLSGTWRR
jgi:hypothetical protein